MSHVPTLTERLTAPPSDPAERRVRTYFCFRESDCLGDGETVTVPVSRLPLLVDALIWDRDFFGMIDDEERTLQVRYDAPRRSWVEVPVVADGGSYGAFMSEAELRAFIIDLPATFTRDTVPRASFVPF